LNPTKPPAVDPNAGNAKGGGTDGSDGPKPKLKVEEGVEASFEAPPKENPVLAFEKEEEISGL